MFVVNDLFRAGMKWQKITTFLLNGNEKYSECIRCLLRKSYYSDNKIQAVKVSKRNYRYDNGCVICCHKAPLGILNNEKYFMEKYCIKNILWYNAIGEGGGFHAFILENR